jgi:ribosomal-protein-alanine N-acetyltransferase
MAIRQTDDADQAPGQASGHGWAIRPAVEDELSQIVVLERETVTAPHWAWRDYSTLLHADGKGSMRRCLYVAADGRVVSGFAVGSAYGPPSQVEAELESVVVRAGMRRQGLGSALCRAVMDWARHQGATAIGLEARAGSGSALRLYGGLGFVAVGRRPRYYHEPEEDAILMRCVLAGGTAAGGGHTTDGQPVLF